MLKRIIAVVLGIVLVMALGACAQAGDTSSDGLHAAVPDVVGMTVPKATEKLRADGYELGTVTPPDATGEVTAQDPIPGTSAPRGSAVDLQAR